MKREFSCELTPLACGREASYLSGPRYDGVLPPCDFPDALVKISVYFKSKEDSFWNTDLRIVAFEKVRETAFRPGLRRMSYEASQRSFVGTRRCRHDVAM